MTAPAAAGSAEAATCQRLRVPPGLPRPWLPRPRRCPAVLDAIERRWHTTHQNTKEVSKRGAKAPTVGRYAASDSR